MRLLDGIFGGFGAYRKLRGGDWRLVKPLLHESEPWGSWMRNLPA